MTGELRITALDSTHPVVAILLAVLVFDFLQWFHHWARHRVKAFWHFHAIHHESVIADVLAFVPMFALGLSTYAVMGVASIRWWYTRFIWAWAGNDLRIPFQALLGRRPELTATVPETPLAGGPRGNSSG